MPGRGGDETTAVSFARHRCRCGHFPTDHMTVQPIGTSGNFRLDPSGPCAICGESACRHYTPGPVGAAPAQP